VYTLDSLKKLLMFHGFEVKKALGYSQVFSKTQVKGVIRLISFLDKIFASKKNHCSKSLFVSLSEIA